MTIGGPRFPQHLWPPTIKARILVAITVLLIAAIALSAILSTLALRSYLEGRVDDRLSQTSERLTSSLRALKGIDLTGAQLREFTDKGTRDIVAAADGKVIGWSGVNENTAQDLVEQSAQFTRPSSVLHHPQLVAVAIDVRHLGLTLHVDGRRVDCDSIILVNDSTDDIATVNHVVRTNVIASLASIVALVVLAAFIVSRGLRPLRVMAEHAEEITAGDRTRRLPAESRDPDIVRLATTVNAAFDAQSGAEARMRSFVADASHELRTPLTTATGWVELYLQGGLREGDDNENAMRRVHSQLSRMRLLVEELALLARLDEATGLRSERVDIGLLLIETVDDALVVNPDRHITVDVGPAHPIVIGDEARLQQVFRNLIGNAAQHTPPSATIHVSVQAQATAEIEIRVTDTGPGIPPEQLPHLFERFWRGDSSRMRSTGGSGLGLAIVRSILDRHGGSINAESGLGVGTTMVVRLPAAGEPSGNHQP